MAFNVSYVYQAIDKFTPIANKIKRSVQNTTKKVRHLRNRMDNAGKSTSAFGNTLSSVRSKLIAFGSAILAAVGIKALVDFGVAMSKVKAISGATGQEFIKMRVLAKELGATTNFSASEAAGGMEFLARAGFETNSILAAMPSVLDLAAASSLDLATAADITSNIMTGFNIAANDTNKIADLMTTITASSNTNIQQLGDAMKYAGPVANKMGQSIEVTAAAMGALSDAGLQGSMAGTGLRRVLSELASPSKTTSRGLKQLGVDMSKINPETNDLITVMKELEKANLTAGQALTVFGDRGGPAFSVLVDNIPKIEKLNKKLQGSAGAAKRLAAIMRDNLHGSAKQAVSAFEGLIITLGDLGLTQALRSLAGALTFVLRFVNMAIDKFPLVTKAIAILTSAIVLAKLAAIGWTLASKGAIFAFASMNLGLITIIASMTTAIALIEKMRSDFDNLQQGEFVRTTIQNDIANMDRQTKFLLERKGDGVAVQQSSNKTMIEGNINVNAPPGVVKSVDFSSKGNAGNLGLSMQGAQ